MPADASPSLKQRPAGLNVLDHALRAQTPPLQELAAELGQERAFIRYQLPSSPLRAGQADLDLVDVGEQRRGGRGA